MPIDLSIAKAIIRRSLTDEDLLRNNRRLNTAKLNRKLVKNSKSSNYRALKIFTDLELQDCLIAKFVQKKKISRYEVCEWVYLDVETAAKERKSEGIKYPSSFYVRVRTIDTKLGFLFAEGDAAEEYARSQLDMPIFQISTHCLERIIQRSNKRTVREAIKIFKPVCTFLAHANIGLMGTGGKLDDGSQIDQILFYWREGYIILKYIPDQYPIILTWLPKDWFSEEQFAKFINFEPKLKKSHMPFAFEASDFNNSKVLSEEDLIEFVFPEEWNNKNKLFA